MRRRGILALLGSAGALWPIAAHAQQPGGVYRVAGVNPSPSAGFLNEAAGGRYWRPFFDELRQPGFDEGRNLVIERHFGDGQADGLADLARRVAASKPNVIYCATARIAAHMKAATATIPIVAVASDPVAFGLIPSLARPGGNLTGVAPDGGIGFYAKHLELLREAAPHASRIAYLTPRAVWDSPVLLAPVKEAASRIGVLLLPAALELPIGEAEYRRAFAAIEAARADALIVGDSAENWSWSRLIIELAALGRLPAIYPDRFFSEQGGLLSFGPDYPLLFGRAGAVIAQILKGANPGDIPFYQASRFEFIVNQKTASTLGISMPSILLAQADEVIE